ncbi:hypothetical protein KY345_04200 [Candidatus Woesearchaeota archaeon]|nr:hypothetical protein [Candidatus Woesearchaeota archaeon]
MHLFNKNTTRADKIQIVLSWVIRIFILLAVIGAILNFRWQILFVSCFAFFLTFLPALIERNFKVYLPAEFEIAIVVFIYASLFLGDVHGYYTRFWWWDIILHIGSALALGFVGFLILFTFYEEKKIKAKPLTIALFAFCFALAAGALWEIFEFTIDSIFGQDMQKSGLVDTMWDLIVDAGGALFTSVIGFIYLKGGKTRLFNHFLEHFIRENPKLFRNK